MDGAEQGKPRKRDRIKARAKRYVRVPLAVRTSDLPKRAGSALVMLGLAGVAIWLGGLLWTLFVGAIALGVLWEWSNLVFRFAKTGGARAIWMVAGALYVFAAAWTIVWLRQENAGYVVLLAGAVIATDVGAYFSGRIIGGPKIAPRISPSKTWAGLLGGSMLTAVFLATIAGTMVLDDTYVPAFIAIAIALGPAIAVIAQCGDFFESWMKRRAAVKDSGNLIPGHGGLFDRMDGLMAVALFLFPFTLVSA